MSIEIYETAPALRRRWQRTPAQQQQSAPHAALLFGGVAGDPYWANVSLLCHFDSSTGTAPTSYVNQVAGGVTPANLTGAVPNVSATQSKFGGKSLFYSASGNTYARCTSSVSLVFGTGDFTVEYWIRLNTVTSDIAHYDSRPSATSALGFLLVTGSSGAMAFFTNNTTGILTSGGLFSTNTWYHVAACRASGTTRLFKDGTQIGANYTDANNYTSDICNIGAAYNGGIPALSSYIDEIRVTKGVARYTSNFTPPTAPFPNF